jgi:hypothetical protein
MDMYHLDESFTYLTAVLTVEMAVMAAMSSLL